MNWWQQDFAHDSSGKFLYVVDRDSGKTWSLSLVRYRTPGPISTQQFLADVAAEMDRLRATTDAREETRDGAE